jgi:hypothetical protein
VAYTISRMQVLERIPGNPIGIGYRWIDQSAVALLRRRVRDAGKAGVDFIFSGAEPMGTSHRNMECARLRLGFMRAKWTPT